jgi:pyruvate dehydrogenase E1 component
MIRPVNTHPGRTPMMAATAPINALESIQRRVLWLATLIVHHANHVRPNPDGTKVGGHQASSASSVSILTALYFCHLRAGDRVAIKPHAAPAYHAIMYLLGRLPRRYLTELRAYGGLQAYPSRTKDPDPVDFSTGSVGLGAVAPAFAALVHRYAETHFGSVTSRRFVALVGDAELDEGNIWEALLDEALQGLGNLLWIVDLNRQSLDRVVPGVRAARLKRMFAEAGWQVLEAKYGRRLEALFAQGTGGAALRQRIDAMSNEEYQALIRLPGAALRPRLVAGDRALARLLAAIDDDDLPATLANLGGHDLGLLLERLAQAGAETQRPTVLFAYTIKGWGLPFAGDPLNHAMLLTPDQIAALRPALGVAPGAEWDAFDPASTEGRLCAEAAVRLFGPPDGQAAGQADGQSAESQPPISHVRSPASPQIPDSLPAISQPVTSTQDAFGRVLVRLADVPGLRERIVTASPDVSVSTNLAGWINKTGVFDRQAQPDFFETETQRILRWRRGPDGQHIELGISEMNLFMLLAMFGLSAELCGQWLIPIGTVYDPFVLRGLDALIYGLYSGAKFIVAGTPSGVTLAPEGGAHQSTVTPSLAAELPRLAAYEPCFAREVEWIMLDAVRACCDHGGGHATYLRLSTRPVEQRLMDGALARLGEAELRRQVLAGGYRLIDRRDSDPEAWMPVVNLAASGAILPEVAEAAVLLRREGVAVNLLNLTSSRRLFEQWSGRDGATPTAQRSSSAARRPPPAPLPEWLILPDERRAPIVAVLDGASHTLAWLGSVYGAPVRSLGVDDFGQSGTRGDLYRHFGIDRDSIAEAAFQMLDTMAAGG